MPPKALFARLARVLGVSPAALFKRTAAAAVALSIAVVVVQALLPLAGDIALVLLFLGFVWALIMGLGS